MPVRLKMQGLSHTATEELPLSTERFIYVVDGALQIAIKHETYDLAKGESLYINAALPHHFINRQKKPAICLVITTPPVL